MDANGPIKYSDLFQPDNSIIELQKQLQDLGNQYKALMDGIKAEAMSLKATLSNVAGSTASGQETIKNASTLAEKLAKKQIELAQANTELARELSRVTQELHKKNNLVKNEVKLAQSEEGSYNALSAQYSINKAKLNAMSQEQRKCTEEGKALEKETFAIRQQMKALQEVTGNHTLSVGDYGIATAHLAADIRNAIQGVAQMRIELKQMEDAGQTGTKQWVDLSQRCQKLTMDLKDLRKTYQRVKLEMNALSQQTGWLNDAMGALAFGSGSLSAVTGTMKLFGINSDNAAQALVKLNAVMAISNGISQAYNALFKQGNVLTKIRNIQTWVGTTAQKANTKATLGAAAAQKVLNWVARQNPYVILATLLAGIVVGLIAWASAAARAAKEQKKLNDLLQTSIEETQFRLKSGLRGDKEEIKDMERKLKVLKAHNENSWESMSLEDEIYKKKLAINKVEQDKWEQEHGSLEDNQKLADLLEYQLIKLKEVKANFGSVADSDAAKVDVQFDLEGPAQRVSVKKAIELIQQKFDSVSNMVQVRLDLKTEEKDLKAEQDVIEENRIKSGQDIADLERSILRKAEDAKLALIKQRFDRQRAVEKANTARAIEDLKVQLKKEKNLTAKARKAINEQIISEGLLLQRRLEEINNEEKEANLSAYREVEDLRMEIRENSFQKEKDLLKQTYDREIQDLKTKLATDIELTEEETDAIKQQIDERTKLYKKQYKELERQQKISALEKRHETLETELEMLSENTTEALKIRLNMLEILRQKELEENKNLSEDLRQDEAVINRKYDNKILQEKIKTNNAIERMTLDADQELAQSEFDIFAHNEYEKEKFRLQLEKKRIEGEIKIQKALLQAATGEEKAAIQKQITALENALKRVDRQMTELDRGASLLEKLGFTDEFISALDSVGSQIVDNIGSIIDAWNDAADAAVDSAEKQVDAAQKILDAEIEARNNGYANRVVQSQKELALAKKNQERALREQAKAQKAKEALDTATQASSLITATAELWASFSGVGPWGVALALAAIAAMWASFGIAKIKAWQVAGSKAKTEQYGEGTVELLQGGSHASGNDISLGTKKDGTERRAEGGEFFAIINKRSSRRYRGVIPDVINSLNNGTFAQKYMSSYAKAGQMALSLSGANSPTDVSRLESDVKDIRKQNENRVYLDANGNTIITYKNLTRKLKN